MDKPPVVQTVYLFLQPCRELAAFSGLRGQQYERQLCLKSTGCVEAVSMRGEEIYAHKRHGFCSHVILCAQVGSKLGGMG